MPRRSIWIISIAIALLCMTSVLHEWSEPRPVGDIFNDGVTIYYGMRPFRSDRWTRRTAVGRFSDGSLQDIRPNINEQPAFAICGMAGTAPCLAVYCNQAAETEEEDGCDHEIVGRRLNSENNQ